MATTTRDTIRVCRNANSVACREEHGPDCPDTYLVARFVTDTTPR